MGNGVPVSSGDTFMCKSWKESMARINDSINYLPPAVLSNARKKSSPQKNTLQMEEMTVISRDSANDLCARVLLCNHSSYALYLDEYGSLSGSFQSDLKDCTFTGPLDSLPSGQCTGFVHICNRSILNTLGTHKSSRGFVKLRVKSDDGQQKYHVVFGFNVANDGNNRAGIRIIPMIRRNFSHDETISSSLSTSSSLKGSPLVSKITSTISPSPTMTEAEMEDLLNVYHTRPSILDMQQSKVDCPLLEMEVFFNNEDAGLFVVNFHDVVKVIRD